MLSVEKKWFQHKNNLIKCYDIVTKIFRRKIIKQKILLGIGSVVAAALPVSVVVACNDDGGGKTAKITTTSVAKVAASVVGSENEYTLAFDNSLDKAAKADLEAALKAMVAKAEDDKETPEFTGTWDTDFDGTKNATYTYTVKATGYNDVTFTVTVSGNGNPTPTPPANEWSWNNPLPNGPFYETAKPDEYTTTLTSGKGYVQGNPGTTKALPTLVPGTTTVDIDGTTYTYQANKKDLEFYYNKTMEASGNKASRVQIPSSFHEASIADITTATNRTSAIGGKLCGTGVTPSDTLYISLGTKTKQIIKQVLTNITFKPETFSKQKLLSKYKKNKRIFIYDEDAQGYIKAFFAKVVQKQAGWDKTLPTGTLYELDTDHNKYTNNESLATGYTQAATPPTKSANDLETAAQAATKNQITIDGNVYTYSK